MNDNKFHLITSKSIPNFKGNINVDSDKSITIRSFLIGSISQGVSVVKNSLTSEDVISTINCLKKLGVKILKGKNNEYKIFGKGLGSLSAKSNTKLNFGNSGTLARLLLGILATTPNIKVRILGDKSLNKRSMRKLIDLLNQFGAEFLPKKKKKFPLKFNSSNLPVGIFYKSGKSAQLKSASILAGLNAYGNTTIVEKEFSRDHTEKILLNNKKIIKISNEIKKIIKVFGKESLNNFKIHIPGDPSSAAFFTALTLLKNKSYLKIKNVGLNPTRIGFYMMLKKSGANIKFKNIHFRNNEKVGDIIVLSSKLRPIKSSSKFYLNSTDEYPILFVLAALIKGKSIFYGIEELANKESNRIKEMQIILKQIGIKTNYKDGVLTINGKKKLNLRNNINVSSLGDHRICMSTVVLSLVTGIKSKIKNFETVRTSSPNFLNVIKKLGGKYEKQKI